MCEFTPTDEQRDAIDWPGNMVITACPGSGKTTVVSEKVRNILPTLASYRGVIAISYTNKASEELRVRCKKDGVEVKGSFFGTIDSFCLREIIYPFAKHVWGMPPAELTIIKYFELTDDQRLLIPHFDNNNHFSTQDLENSIVGIRALFSSGVILLESVGALAFYVVRNSAACQRYLRARYTHIFIDEYQDSGGPQHELFMEISSLGLLAIAVGDVDQSIFGFSGRSPEFLIELRDQDDNFQSFEITVNHRCHPSIVNYSRRILAPDCDVAGEEDIRVFRKTVIGDQNDIAEWISSVLPNLMDEYGVEKNREVGILVRGKPTSGFMRDYLRVPCRLFEEDPLSKSSSLLARVFSSLIYFRLDPSITAQSIISQIIVRRLSLDDERRARGVINRCRMCDDEELFDSLQSAGDVLAQGHNDQDAIVRLREVLESPYYLGQYRPVRDDEVQIMNIHKAKGLEFKIVFHLDLYDWILPRRAFIAGCYDEIFEDINQCLNLHYVGVTRAEEVCILVTSTERYNNNMDLKNGNPSQFLALPGLDNLYLNM